MRLVAVLVTDSILFCWFFTIKGQCCKGERIYQDYFGDFFLRVILRFVFQLETILKTIYSEKSCQSENSPQNSLQTENEPLK